MKIIKIIIFLILFQDILALCLAKMPISSSILLAKYALAFKEMICYICFICYFISLIRHNIKPLFLDGIVILYCTYFFLYIVIPSSLLVDVEIPLEVKIISARTLLWPVMLYSIGRLLIHNRNDGVNIFSYYIKISTISIIIGTILCLMPNTFWHTIGIENLYKTKLGGEDFELLGVVINDSGMPLNFYIDTYTTYGEVRRFSSTIIDPISSGLLIAGLVIFSRCFREYDQNRFRTLFFIFATVISLSKGAIFIAMVGYLFISLKHRWKFLNLAIIMYFLIITSSSYLEFSNIKDRGPALLTTFEYMIDNPLGKGLGTSSYLSLMNLGDNPLKDEDLSRFSLESYFGTMCIQVGLVGGIFFITFMIGLIATNYNLYNLLNNYDKFLSQMSLGGAAISIGLLLVSIISASGFGFVGAGTSLLMVGIIIGCSLDSAFALSESYYCATTARSGPSDELPITLK